MNWENRLKTLSNQIVLELHKKGEELEKIRTDLEIAAIAAAERTDALAKLAAEKKVIW